MRFVGAFFLLIFAVLFSWHCSHENDQTLAVQTAAREELQRYPQATLLDLYKFFFQGAFGPGHLIPDAEAARQYLEEELRASTSFDTVRWQSVGHQGRYYRINLSLVYDGSVSSQTLLAAFIESANGASPPSLEEWREEWQMILGVIENMALDLPDFERDKNALAQRLAEGKTMGHHSETFEQLYQPHYRVVDKEHFKALVRHYE
jgi:hypothetical protein